MVQFKVPDKCNHYIFELDEIETGHESLKKFCKEMINYAEKICKTLEESKNKHCFINKQDKNKYANNPGTLTYYILDKHISS
ncbi:hypothetical protein BpHYR1_036369 [Brachionus plicatilis]|uniref:Uncharacterized protein n=1 Tax=Brachionus plicatilis TaxID=10195 RepID=A0A3M7QPB0_BRAPC|nr:hypothetical protein BpHYR1_036369 [Brachionus plicatilis]